MAETDSFLCPVTLERMMGPVVAADGCSNERAAITDWLATHTTSPATCEVMAKTTNATGDGDGGGEALWVGAVAAAAQQETGAASGQVMCAQFEALQLHELEHAATDVLEEEVSLGPTNTGDHAPPWTFVDGAASQLLCTPELTASILAMFPRGRVPSQLRLLVARDGGIDVETFKAVSLNVDDAMLVIIRNTDDFLFGAVIFDRGHVLSDVSGDVRCVAGDADNFLFRLAGNGAEDGPTKLVKSADPQFEQCGLWLGQANVGLCVGYHDLNTFRGDGTGEDWCIPSAFTTVAPGYPPVPVTNRTLAGAEKWVPRRSEVYAMSAYQ